MPPADEEKKKYALRFADEFLDELRAAEKEGALPKAGQDALAACVEIKEGKAGAYKRCMEAIQSDPKLRARASIISLRIASEKDGPYGKGFMTGAEKKIAEKEERQAQAVAVQEAAPAPEEEKVRAKFGEPGLRIYRMIDGTKMGDALAKEAGMDDEEAARLVVAMVKEGLLSLEGSKFEEPKMSPKWLNPGPGTMDTKQLNRLASAYALYGFGDFGLDAALSILSELPKGAETSNNAGCVYYKKKDFAKAAGCFARAGNAGNAEAGYNTALALLSTEEYEKAEETLNSVSAGCEGGMKADALYLRGLACEFSGKYAYAAEDFRKALSLKPEFPEARAHLESARRKTDGAASGTAPSGPGISFAELGGMEALKKMFRLEIVELLKNPGLATRYGKSFRGGYLLYGPPGCGKSMLAEAVAGEAGLALARANINSILNMYVGNSEKNLAAIFAQARRNQPALVFFDEIDALGGKRENLDQQWQKTLVNVFLAEMDRIERNRDKIVVFGATNAPWDIDAALRRSGRLGKEVFVPPPDEKSRAEIISLCSMGLPLEGVDFGELARLTRDFSAANLKSICGKAANRAWEDAVGGKEGNVTMGDFLEAIKSEKSDVLEWMAVARKTAWANKEEAEKEMMYG